MKASLSIFFTLTFFLFMSCETAEKIESGDATNSIAQQENPGPYECNLTDLGINQSLGSPTSITEAIELINALPRPLNIPCFLSALNRPLKVNLTNSGRSAQPAKGNDNPRIFIMNDPLIMSVSVEGGASVLLEFAELTSDQRSIKGELHFPIYEQVIALAAPFERVASESASKCSGCHIQESKVTYPGYSGDVYESLAMKPMNGQKITVSNFKLESYKCDMLQEIDYRCHMIYGIFNHGEVVHEDFPIAMLTFFDSFGL